MILLVLISIFVSGQCGPATENYKGQYCTDPRTMRKHAAYTEWADAYSCTRHRCQPGGRNLAIYTVGCKRVEAPESAIECEEVVEDTNMQFPYCCTRLRCLVVVRGEVWTRVLGQPWESLPAAPWSHMYKMKKPPPGDTNFLPKVPEQGPVYELAEPEADNKVLRSMLAPTTETPNMKPDPSPDIVIALSTNNEQKSIKNELESLGEVRSKYVSSNRFDDDREQEPGLETDDNTQMTTEKSENSLEDRYYDNLTGTSKPGYSNLHNAHEWTDIPSQHWHARAEGTTESDGYNSFHQLETGEEKAEPKSTKLQALVNAIGTRMRDIENVVQKMTAKVHDAKVPDEYNSAEKGQGPDDEHSNKDLAEDRTKKPNEGDYKRFTSKVHANKYVRGSEMTTDLPLFLEDSHLNGYFSDASNSVLRRSNKQGAMQTYMAPVETRRKNTHILDSSAGTDVEKKHKKHHKKKKGKHGHKKHHKMDKRKKFSRISSSEFDKNVIVSLEDSSAVKK